MTNTINPGDGYRLLAPDEVIQEGDEYYEKSEVNPWDETIYGAKDSMNSRLTGQTYRRKITQPANGWISVKDRLPKEGDVVWIAKSDRKVTATDKVTLNGCQWHDGTYTHWKPLQLPEPPAPEPPAPEPPAPEPSAAERAWETYRKQVLKGGECVTGEWHKGWLTGYEFATKATQ